MAFVPVPQSSHSRRHINYLTHDSEGTRRKGTLLTGEEKLDVNVRYARSTSVTKSAIHHQDTPMYEASNFA